ncbi:hypothetical protein FCL40_09505 [Ferrimonas sediminicola]|uniref:Uncharacterized protein n=1 Tax=Ferrimonas sediminicola TaxID=2569538 RepID=A0A4U1BCU7_9GAMM|nr:DUF6702 family protein [Ferrimonas sediminicola]TKB48869.1 hypothetical protein FCL40_09505 [Ferrimonas sediminicola]
MRPWLLVLALLCGSAWAHQYHFGLTEMALSRDGHSLEIIHRYSARDMGLALELPASKGFADAEPQLRAYMEKHFRVETDTGLALRPDWVGIDPNVRDLLIYQELPIAKYRGQPLTITLTLLQEVEPSQVNTLNLQGFQDTQSWQLNRASPSVTLTLP